jgi:hypothetical protein
MRIVSTPATRAVAAAIAAKPFAPPSLSPLMSAAPYKMIGLRTTM